MHTPLWVGPILAEELASSKDKVKRNTDMRSRQMRKRGTKQRRRRAKIIPEIEKLSWRSKYVRTRKKKIVWNLSIKEMPKNILSSAMGRTMRIMTIKIYWVGIIYRRQFSIALYIFSHLVLWTQAIALPVCAFHMWANHDQGDVVTCLLWYS